MTTKIDRYDTLTAQTRQRLFVLTEQHGTDAVCRMLRVAPATLARAIAGLPIMRSMTTHLLVQLANETDLAA